MATAQTPMLDSRKDPQHPDEGGCNDTMRCTGCGGQMRRELIPEMFENDAQVYLGWRSGYRCCGCGKLPQAGQDLGMLMAPCHGSR